MTYRNDADALEARLDVLEKDVVDRTRERDEVARMLAEARNTDAARRWIEGASRRRRRRMIMLGMIASTLLIAAAIATVVRLRHDARRERVEQVFHEFEQFADRACQCVDAACGTKVTNMVQQWAEDMAKHEVSTDDKPDPEMVKRMSAVAERYGECLMKAMAKP